MKRQAAALTDGTFDLLIIGGGITGAGVALDAALRGLRVALIDKGDFASGTSSASSKLVHGGLRYLEHFQFHLVYEALHERRRLLRNAPHLVQPLRFVLPFYQGGRVPPWKWRAGLTLYDLLAGSGNLRRSRSLPKRRLQGEFPFLDSHGLVGGAEYFDAQMDDARLCLAVLRTASEHGACLGNYVEAMAFELREGRITGVRASDRVTGKEFTIRARQVLNAAGPWVDQVCRLAGDASVPHLRPTKGVHLVAASPLAFPGQGKEAAAFLLLHPADGRVFFVIPWMSPAVYNLGLGSCHRLPDLVGSPLKPKILIGTTDTLCADLPEQLSVTASEIAYLLEGYNRYFAPPLTEAAVMGSFVGLRPLIRSRPGQPSSLSREFRLFEAPSGLLSATGGKYTTYRRMAEVITDAIARRLGRQRRGRTRDFPLDGAPPGRWSDFVPAETAILRRRHGLAEDSARHLVHRYGSRAAEAAAYLTRDPALARRVTDDEPDLLVEFAYQRDHEMAVFPADFLLRRTRLGLFHPEILKQPPEETRASSAG